MRLRAEEHVTDIRMVLDDTAHDLLEAHAQPKFGHLLELVNDHDSRPPLRTKLFRQTQRLSQFLDSDLTRIERKRHLRLPVFTERKNGTNPLEKPGDVLQCGDRGGELVVNGL